MAKRKTAALELPPFPPLTRGEFHWEGRVKLPAWAGFQSRQGAYAGRNSKKKSDGTVRVSIAVEDDEPAEHQPTPEQAEAFRYLLKHQKQIRDAILAAVFDEYPTARQNYAGDFDIEDEKELAKVLPVLKRPAELKAVIGLSTIHLSPVVLARQAYLGFEFGCNWEEEHGLGVLIHSGRVAAVGHADVCFLEWVAEDDAKKQGRKARKK